METEKNKPIKEELDVTTLSLFKYMAVIDMMEVLKNNRSMMNYVFTEKKPEEIRAWFRYLYDSKAYNDGDLKKKLMSLSSRMYGDEKIKTLYKVLNKILTSPFSEDGRDEREADVKRLMRKISIYVKNKLTDDDKESVDRAFAYLDVVSRTIKDNMMQLLDRHMEVDKSEPKDEDPDTEKAPSKKDVESDEKPKKESLYDNFYKRKLKKKIREMIRTAIISKKFTSK